MSDFCEDIERERVRLDCGLGDPITSSHAGWSRFLCRTSGRADDVIERSKDILKIINQHSRRVVWPEDDEWARLLPDWFVVQFAPEESRKESEARLRWWRTLPRDQQMEAEESWPWTLEGWIYWFTPAVRQWYWRDACVLTYCEFSVEVEHREWLFPSGALNWMLRVCGSETVGELDG